MRMKRHSKRSHESPRKPHRQWHGEISGEKNSRALESKEITVEFYAKSAIQLNF